MRLTSLMMYISPVLIFILYVYVGFSEAAPRISSYDASPISRKPGSASDTWGIFHTDMPHSSAERRSVPGPLTGLTPWPAIVSPGPAATTSPVSKTATTFQPPTTDPTTTTTTTTATATTTTTTASVDTGLITDTKEQITAPVFKLTGARKRSTDAQTSLFAPEKMLQTMVSMVSQRSTNDAWAADNIGTSLSSIENSEESFCNCSSDSEGILDPNECDHSTGQCSCLAGYSGLQCKDCEEGYFNNGTNGTGGCLPCACDSFGAVNHLCDSSGICVCKTGVYGPKCDECHPGFFHFSSTGCRPCQCHNHTSYCQPQSGVCLNCEDNTQGSNCDECKPGFYRGPGAPLTEACAPCPCSNSTSTGTCHTDPSGLPVCDQCLPQYSSPQCDRCSAGFYKTSGACVPCDCSGNADPQGPTQLCHPDTGHCLHCINNTTGPQCQLCAPGFIGDARAHNCTRPSTRLIPPPAATTTTTEPPSSTASSPSTPTTSSPTARGVPASTTGSNMSTVLTTAATTQALLTSLSGPTDNTTAALTEVSWTQFNIIILAVIILVVLLLLGFVGGVYTYREYQNRKLNAPFWTIELKEDNISFSSYHDSIPNADVSGLLEDEANEVAPNGQLALTTQGNCYKA